jgi:hypothetical protein
VRSQAVLLMEEVNDHVQESFIELPSTSRVSRRSLNFVGLAVAAALYFMLLALDKISVM